jgi:hypothetical protein
VWALDTPFKDRKGKRQGREEEHRVPSRLYQGLSSVAEEGGMSVVADGDAGLHSGLSMVPAGIAESPFQFQVLRLINLQVGCARRAKARSTGIHFALFGCCTTCVAVADFNISMARGFPQLTDGHSTATNNNASQGWVMHRLPIRFLGRPRSLRATGTG